MVLEHEYNFILFTAIVEEGEGGLSKSGCNRL